jgi:tripartite-type tricarboxylate transporter receptor subunit TctC
MKRRTLALAALANILPVGATVASAQATPWPTRTVRIIVPFAAGGTADILGRIMAERLTAKWGQPVVVENRPGAGGNIGAEAVARAAPDGYTLLVGTVGIHAASSIYARLTYDPVRELAPVTVIAEMPNAILVHPSVPARTLQELVDLAKRDPGQLTFGSAGNGSSTHLAGEAFLLSTGVRITHVPYRGSSAALNDLVAGNINVMFENLPTVPPLAQAGSVRVLAVTSRDPVAQLPGVPAARQAGAPDYVATAWMTLAAPAGVPAPLLERISADARAVLNEPAVRQRLETLGAIPIAGSVEESRAFFAAETEKWTRVINAAGIRLN